MMSKRVYVLGGNLDDDDGGKQMKGSLGDTSVFDTARSRLPFRIQIHAPAFVTL